MQTMILIGLVVIATLVSFNSCGVKRSDSYTNDEEITITKVYSFSGIKIAEIDSCEYIICAAQSGYVTCHKGNCKYCKQRNEKK